MRNAIGTLGLMMGLAAVACTVKSTESPKGTGGAGGGGTTDTGTGAGNVGGQAGSTYTSSGNGGAPTTCDAQAGDDACTSCSKTSCCNEIMACDQDAACSGIYGQYRDCLFPQGGDWSGFSTNYCRQAVDTATASAAADAMIGCFLAQCSATDACGPEPVAKFASPPTGNQDFSAAQFIEDFCVGCHVPGFVPPSGQTLTQFSNDPAWTSPEGNPDWFKFMQYQNIVNRQQVLWCGIHPDVLPDGCDQLNSPPVVVPGFFDPAKPGKFPPSGTGNDSHGNPNPCTFASDGMTCPQPTHFQRARMVSWLLEMPPPQ
jgi:hypothetical protein